MKATGGGAGAREARAGLDVALVADDLTGALDASAPFAAHGLRVRVYRGAGAAPAGPDTAADGAPAVAAVDTASRHLPPDAARAAVEAAGRRLRERSPRLVFKKVDSTLRGPVADEVQAAMAVFGRRAALVCPAFPAAGRTVQGGEVFVHGAPLRETEYARDLRTPAPSGSLETLFARTGPVAGLRTGDPLPRGALAGAFVADARTEADLRHWAGLVAERAQEVLAVGSDGLAAGLAGRLGGAARALRLSGGAAGADDGGIGGEREGARGAGEEGGALVLFAIGSRTDTCARQVEALLQARPGAPVVEAPGGVLDADAVLGAARVARAVVARIAPSPAGDPEAVARAFGAGVRAVLERLARGRPVCLAAAGGDTVDAILEACGVAALDVLGEFRPGVPVSRPAGGGGRPGLTLVSKAGGFGAPDLFPEIAAEAVR